MESQHRVIAIGALSLGLACFAFTWSPTEAGSPPRRARTSTTLVVSTTPSVPPGDSSGADTPDLCVLKAEEPTEAVVAAAHWMALDPTELRAVVSSSSDPIALQWAVWTMGNRLDLSDEDIATILERLRRDGAEHPRAAAAMLWVLTARPERIPVADCCRLAAGHPDARVRRNAVRALSQVPGRAAGDALRLAARDDADAQNRREAIVALSVSLDPSEHVSIARAGLAGENDPTVRARWISMLASSLDPAVAGELESILRSSHETTEALREAAAGLVQLNPGLASRWAEDLTVPEDVRRDLVALRRALASTPGAESSR